jgi:hypothetical protein
MVSTERKDMARKVLVGQCDPAVGLEALDDLLNGDLPSQAEVKIGHMHVLSVDFGSRGKEVEVEPQGLKKVVGIPGLVGAKAHVVVLSHFGSREKLAFLTDIIRSPSADENPLL